MPNAFEKSVKALEKDTSKHLTVIVMIALIVITGGSGLIYFAFRDQAYHQEWVAHTYQVSQELDLTLSSLKDAETGVRGFLLTKDEASLQPFHEGKTEVWRHYKNALNLTKDNSQQLTAIETIAEPMRSRISLLEGILVRARANEKLSPTDFSFLEGKTMMDLIRAKMSEMKVVEDKLLAERAKRADFSTKVFIICLIVSTIISLLAVSYALWKGRESLVKSIEDARQSKIEADERAHLSETARLVSGEQTSRDAADKVLSYIASNFQAPVANLYVWSEKHLQLLASFAPEEIKNDKTKLGEFAPVALVEGQKLLGEAFKKNTPTVIKNVPKEYLQISSSIGKATPQTLIFIPIIFQGTNIGIIELGCFVEQSPEAMALLEEIARATAVGLNAAVSREHLQRLFEQTQQQAEELQAQQEELRTSNEELEEQARALESQQQALNLRNRELETARVEIEQKASDLIKTSRYKSDFLAKMSHELRTPLNSLMILASLLIENKDKNLTDKQKEFARSIHSAGSDLLNLINDILDLSKIEAQKLALRPQSIRVVDFLTHVHSTFLPQFDAKKVAFKLDLEQIGDDFEILTDRQRLEQILRNLISNAIKFTEKGHVTLAAEKRGTTHIAFHVSDTGIGIPHNKLALIFEAFEQVDSSLSRMYNGTGLGLTISRELSQLLKGSISVESTEASGSRFTVLIPVKYAENMEIQKLETPAPLPVESKESFSEEAKKLAVGAIGKVKDNSKSILIVEDDSHFRRLVAEATRPLGFEPIEAEDGEVALAILERHTPSAILLDIKLPGISGLGLLEIIKRSPALRHIPTHMISALEHQHSALRIGAMGYLTKPVTIEKVKSALSRIENIISKKMKNILIIEDDKRQQEAIQHLIGGSDILISVANRAHEAIDKVKASGFDCIILDLNLPDMSGFELLDKLSNLDVSLPPIVIYTGRDLSREETDRLGKFSNSIILKGAKSPERLLDEVNLFLHRVESTLPQEQQQMLQTMRGEEQPFEGRSVLVVDDDLRNIFAMTQALEEKGFEVHAARDGIEAIEWLKNADRVDAILMDIMMPKMDGFEAMKLIRKMNKFQKTPIVALTAKAMRGDHEKCIAAGASDYLPKPVNLMNLFSVLKVWLPSKEMFS